MRPSPSYQRRARAFTLIELLIVITIIAILAGILVPVLNQVKATALKTTARNDCVQLANAIVSFKTEYGRWPLREASTTDPAAIETDSQFMQILIAEEAPESGSSALNSRGLVFFEGKTQGRIGTHGIDTDGNLYDPWGKFYEIKIDGNYDNKVDDFTDGSDPIRKGVIVRSSGPDKVFEVGGETRSDDVKSWQ